jgi:hypothetical protein
MGAAPLNNAETLGGSSPRALSPSLAKTLPSPAGLMRSSRTSRPNAAIIRGAAMLIMRDIAPGCNPQNFAAASNMDDCMPPKARARKFFPESRRDAVAGDARLGSITALATSDAFTLAGAPETRSNIRFIQPASPVLFASAPRRVAFEVSQAFDTACSGAPSCDAKSLTARESRALKSELKTVDIIKQPHFLSNPALGPCAGTGSSVERTHHGLITPLLFKIPCSKSSFRLRGF